MDPAELGRPRRRCRTAAGLVPLVAVLVLVAGCGNDPGSTAAPDPTGGTSTTEGGEQPVGPVEEAVADLAERLDVAPGDIEVLETEAVTWKDGSLGCPEPGAFYTQALVEGHRIVLRSGDRTYPYHSGGGRGPFLCENLQPSIPPEPGGDR